VQSAASALHWVDLVSGEFFRRHRTRFRREDAADGMLLRNLIAVRKRLLDMELPSEISHDLLARLIFIQFLFQRKDSLGRPALNQRVLRNLASSQVLRRKHSKLTDILEDYEDAYRFFRWLNDRFNGDLFPGKGATEQEREAEWQREMDAVRPRHLQLLSEFVRGTIDLKDDQFSLWPQYYFDAIPLEFISSIYEVFVGEDGSGVHYTPSHIVDFVLDGVLPWDDDTWDVQILDPACGSGIFLVKAYQRLIHRWKRKNPGEDPPAELLKRLLERNLRGVDIDPDAVRVASFSLYLAMCDAIDPRHYWQRVRFPRLRETQLVASDFFEERQGIRTDDDAGRYDLIIGNAPWGRKSLTPVAKEWANQQGWRTAYKDIGPLFLPKAARLVRQDGWISMLQPAGAVLFNSGVNSANKFRAKLFSEFSVAEIVNLSALRFGLFEKAIAPTCIITMQGGPPTDPALTYVCPKPLQTSEDDYRFVVEPGDVHMVFRHEAANDPLVWTVLAWGSRRDYSLVRRLNAAGSLEKLEAEGIAVSRQGVIRGDQSKYQPLVLGRRILEATKFPKGAFLTLDAEELPENEDPMVHSRDSVNFDAFRTPQLIIKQSWLKAHRRFQAAMVVSDSAEGVLCSKSYISVHVPNEHADLLRTACLVLNSRIAAYFLLLSSGRFASYRPEANKADLLAVPIPSAKAGTFKSLDEIDRWVLDAFELSEPERSLVDDLFDYTLPDFKGDLSSPGRRKTARRSGDSAVDELEGHLSLYSNFLLKALAAGFGADKQILISIFHDVERPLPIRMLGVHLEAGRSGVDVHRVEGSDLYGRLKSLNQKLLGEAANAGSIYQRRVARVFDKSVVDGRAVPTVYYIKPDQVRYWTRSAALRDADELAAEILTWQRMATLPVDEVPVA
ncbi:MAG: N-6 DNA methylase, partial [Gemmatimonadota bacterium]